MKNFKIIIASLLVSLIISCGNEDELPQVNLRLMNNSDVTFVNTTITTKGSSVSYANINGQQSSEYIVAVGLTNSINLEVITTSKDTLRVIQIDPPRNENIYMEGNYTRKISIIDGRIQYEIIKD
jgi:hypothetical protein